MSDAPALELAPILRDLADAVTGMRDELARQDPNRWDTLRNEAQKALMVEMQAQRRVTTQLVAVLRDVHDELHLFRAEMRYLRERDDREARFAAVTPAAASSG